MWYSVEEIAMNPANLWAFFIFSVVSYAQALEDLGGMSKIYNEQQFFSLFVWNGMIHVFKNFQWFRNSLNKCMLLNFR